MHRRWAASVAHPTAPGDRPPRSPVARTEERRGEPPRGRRRSGVPPLPWLPQARRLRGRVERCAACSNRRAPSRPPPASPRHRRHVVAPTAIPSEDTQIVCYAITVSHSAVCGAHENRSRGPKVALRTSPNEGTVHGRGRGAGGPLAGARGGPGRVRSRCTARTAPVLPPAPRATRPRDDKHSQEVEERGLIPGGNSSPRRGRGVRRRDDRGGA